MKKHNLMKILIVIVSGLLLLFILGWLGLRIIPAPFPAYPQQTAALERVPLPEGLPAPVERFYQEVYGETVPVIESAVISGRAEMRIGGILFPARFRFTHKAGQAYRHYIEATLYGLPLMKVNEYYLDSRGRMELPFGVTEGEPKIDQAANLGLWAESLWLPSIYLTDGRVRWEPVDEVSARLIVPFGSSEQEFLVRFDSETGLPRLLEAMRYRDAGDAEKIPWRSEALEWGRLNGDTALTIGAATWLDQGAPWAVFSVEEVVYNVDVEAYLRAKGP